MKNDSPQGEKSAPAAGTVTADPARYQVRRATSADVDEIFKLTSAMAKKGLMLSRSKYKIITMLTGFFVVIDNGGGEDHPDNVVACGAFVPLWTDMGEIIALAVKDAYQGKGVGRLLIDALIAEGRRLQMKEVITLTYQVDFFAKMGFVKTDKDRFPRKLWRECLECPKLEECDETAMHYML